MDNNAAADPMDINRAEDQMDNDAGAVDQMQQDDDQKSTKFIEPLEDDKVDDD